MIVADAAPLIHLSKIGRLDLLRQVYGNILIPRGVYDEVVVQAEGRPGASEVETGIRKKWIKTTRATVPRVLEDEGASGADGEVIALAENKQTSLLTNDRVVATIARSHGIRVIWLTQAIVEASRKGLVTNEEAMAILRELVRAGLRVRSEVLAEIFHILKEDNRKT